MTKRIEYKFDKDNVLIERKELLPKEIAKQFAEIIDYDTNLSPHYPKDSPLMTMQDKNLLALLSCYNEQKQFLDYLEVALTERIKLYNKTNTGEYIEELTKQEKTKKKK